MLAAVRCHACAIDIPDDGRFCPECGAIIIGPKQTLPGSPLDDSLAVPERPKPPKTMVEEPPAPSPWPSRAIRGLLAALGSGLALVALDYFYPSFREPLLDYIGDTISGNDVEYARSFAGIVLTSSTTFIVSFVLLLLSGRRRS